MELPRLGSSELALSLFLQPKHGAFNNGSKTLFIVFAGPFQHGPRCASIVFSIFPIYFSIFPLQHVPDEFSCSLFPLERQTQPTTAMARECGPGATGRDSGEQDPSVVGAEPGTMARLNAAVSPAVGGIREAHQCGGNMGGGSGPVAAVREIQLGSQEDGERVPKLWMESLGGLSTRNPELRSSGDRPGSADTTRHTERPDEFDLEVAGREKVFRAKQESRGWAGGDVCLWI